MRPNYLELRYIDAFDASLVDTADLVQFVKAGTSMRLEMPPFFSRLDAYDVKGRIGLQAPIKKWKDTQFMFDLGSGTRGGAEDIVRLETKVAIGLLAEVGLSDPDDDAKQRALEAYDVMVAKLEAIRDVSLGITPSYHYAHPSTKEH